MKWPPDRTANWHAVFPARVVTVRATSSAEVGCAYRATMGQPFPSLPGNLATGRQASFAICMDGMDNNSQCRRASADWSRSSTTLCAHRIMQYRGTVSWRCRHPRARHTAMAPVSVSPFPSGLRQEQCSPYGSVLCFQSVRCEPLTQSAALFGSPSSSAAKETRAPADATAAVNRRCIISRMRRTFCLKVSRCVTAWTE